MCYFKPVSFGVTSYASLPTDTRSNRAKQQGLSAPWLEFLLWALMTEGAQGPGVGGWVLGVSFQQKDSSSCGHGAIYVPPAPPQPLLRACGLNIRSTCPSKACGPSSGFSSLSHQLFQPQLPHLTQPTAMLSSHTGPLTIPWTRTALPGLQAFAYAVPSAWIMLLALVTWQTPA